MTEDRYMRKLRNFDGLLAGKASKEYVDERLSFLDGGDLDPVAGYPFGPLDLSTPDGWIVTGLGSGPDDEFSVTEPTIGANDEKVTFTTTGTAGEYEMHIERTGTYGTWILPIWYIPQPLPPFSEQPTGLRVDGEVKSGPDGDADLFAWLGQRVSPEGTVGTEPYSEYDYATEFWIQSSGDVDVDGWSLDSARYPIDPSYYDHGPNVPGGPYESAFLFFQAYANGDGALVRNVTVIHGELA